MAAIKIDDITPAGAELFVDSENFMEELSNDELLAVLGGKIWTLYDMNGKQISLADDGKGFAAYVDDGKGFAAYVDDGKGLAA